ncbi:MAG: TatD family hydrolase [Cardiobacteriaceae bacterium]|nr:TatD family hydrolase [Cardiobacteriaceae bacterium]
MLYFTDSHCHLDWFTEPATIAHQAKEIGVWRIVIPAISVRHFEAVKQSALLDGVYAAYGLHPLYQAEHLPEHHEILQEWVARENPIAIGECGLDYFYTEHQALHSAQMETFLFQLKLAKRFDLPLLLHARKSLDAILHQLKRHAIKRFVIHSFTGSDQQLSQILDMGGYVGIGGTSTYPRASRLQRQLAILPANRFLLETDAPDQPLCGRQGIENTPDQTFHVAKHLAQLRGCSLAEISEQSEANAKRFFGW